MKLVILAGGKGTRMGAMTEFIPKPMVPLMRKPILEHQIHFAKKYGFDEVKLIDHTRTYENLGFVRN